jgi:hypothetical protein
MPLSVHVSVSVLRAECLHVMNIVAATPRQLICRVITIVPDLPVLCDASPRLRAVIQRLTCDKHRHADFRVLTTYALCQ